MVRAAALRGETRDASGWGWAGRLQGLVFLTILMTVGIQGLTAQPLARILDLIAESPEEASDATTSAISEATTQALPIVPDSGQ